MFKKIVWLLSTVAILTFIGCGSSSKSSDEGKELMTKILNFVGIPSDIVVAICIDKDKNGVCASTEVQAKVTLNKGDSFDDIWEKLALNEEGQYFLEIYDETLPILVQIQDEANVDFDNGKFTLPFDGFKTTEDKEEKEISILQSMVDADAITTNEADKFRTLTNTDAQNKYYTTLLSDLETNINTLRVKGLDSNKATIATIKEMADETKANQEQADKINGCGNDQTCIDKEIKSLSEELIITEEESNTIVPSENNNQDSENQQFGKWVTPSKSDCESNGGSYGYNGENKCQTYWENAKNICKASGDELPTTETLSAVITDCGGVIDDSDNNRNNESYQSCYKEKGFIYRLYFSSPTNANDNDNGWVVNFYLGIQYYNYKEYSGYVRCVRAGQ